MSFLPERDRGRFVSSRRPGGRFSDHCPLGDVTVMSVDFCQKIFQTVDAVSSAVFPIPECRSRKRVSDAFTCFVTGFFVSVPTVSAEGRHMRKPFFMPFLHRDVDGSTEGLFCSFFRRCIACRENGRTVFLKGKSRHRRRKNEERPLLLPFPDIFKI